jgi:hypothetical protein
MFIVYILYRYLAKEGVTVIERKPRIHPKEEIWSPLFSEDHPASVLFGLS